MIDRRQLLTVGGGLLTALGPSPSEAAPPGEGGTGAGQQLSPQNAQDIVNALKDIRAAIAADGSFQEIIPVRNKQLEFLRARGKFPDFIDVGSDIWYAVHDWHVRLQQPLVFNRDATGRYTLMLGFTALVLRPEAVPGFVSTPYDT